MATLLAALASEVDCLSWCRRLTWGELLPLLFFLALAAERFLLLPLDEERSFLLSLALLFPLPFLFCLCFFDLLLDGVDDEELLALEESALFVPFLRCRGLALLGFLFSSFSLRLLFGTSLFLLVFR